MAFPYPVRLRSSSRFCLADSFFAVGNPRVRGAGCVYREEVLILSEDDATLAEGMGGLHFVGRFEKPRLGSARHVDTAASKSDGQGTRTVLIQVEAYRPWHQRQSFA